MTLTLYPHQSKMIADTRAALATHDSVLLVGPTGVGKTVLTGSMLSGAQAKGRRVVFCVHRDELITQSVNTLQAMGVTPGVIAAGYPEDPHALVQVASVMSLAVIKRLLRTPQPDLLIFDEAQHATSSSWKKIRATWSTCKLVGLTATPCRLDGRGLGEMFQTMAMGPEIDWLIANGYLSGYRAFAPTKPTLTNIVIQKGDFARNATEYAMNKPSITGDAVATYLKHAAGRRAIAFCVGIKHSKDLVAAMLAANVRAAHLDGETPRNERKLIMASFRAGGLDVLSNVDLFSEGLDVPAAEVGIFLRPTVSVGLWRQQVGRVLRYQPGKTALLFDHAGNFERHGLPDDVIAWSLNGVVRAKRDASASMLVRTCGSCYAVSKATSKACDRCGTPFPLTPREIKKLEGELAEITKLRARVDRAKEKRAARTLDDLVALGKKRGYSNPAYWALKQMEVRARKHG